MNDSPQPRRESQRGQESDSGSESPRWLPGRVDVALGLMVVIAGALTATVVILLLYLPEFLELGWALVESANRLAESIEGANL